MDDPLAGLDRLSDDALGPCACCGKVILATGMPIFYRVTVEHCGIDKKAVDAHVGLAMSMGGGTHGLTLASVMGPGTKPVVVMGKGTKNVCLNCSQQEAGIMTLVAQCVEGGVE